MSRLKRAIRRNWHWTRARVATLLRPDRILLIHIPKTAGTSLRKMLQEEYGAMLVYPGDWHLGRGTTGFYPPGREMLDRFRTLPPHNVLVGHVAASFADLLPTPYQSVTFLRDPVQRSLSFLNHWSRINGVSVEKLLDDTNFISQAVADYQTRALGGEGVCDPGEVERVDDATLARAIRRLDSMDFVGLTERFEQSCALFDGRFGTSISRRCLRENVLRPQGDELGDLVARIEPLVRRDQALYAAAAERLEAGCW